MRHVSCRTRLARYRRHLLTCCSVCLEQFPLIHTRKHPDSVNVIATVLLLTMLSFHLMSHLHILARLFGAGRHWRIDVAMSCRKFFRTFNCLLSKSSKFAEPVMQQLVDSYCKPILIYNIAASIASKAVLSKTNSVWNSAWCKW